MAAGTIPWSRNQTMDLAVVVTLWVMLMRRRMHLRSGGAARCEKMPWAPARRSVRETTRDARYSVWCRSLMCCPGDLVEVQSANCCTIAYDFTHRLVLIAFSLPFARLGSEISRDNGGTPNRNLKRIMRTPRRHACGMGCGEGRPAPKARRRRRGQGLKL